MSPRRGQRGGRERDGAKAAPEAAASPRRVAVVLGSDSDRAVMAACLETLAALEVPADLRILSAHRTPREAHAFAERAHETYGVVIAAAGGAAHLAGTIAGMTAIPVIGVPLASSPLQGQDALLSTVMMPPGVPVATVSIGEWGARNAAVLAAQILATADPALAARVRAWKAKLGEKVLAADRAARGEAKGGGAPAAAAPAKAPSTPMKEPEVRYVRPKDVGVARRRGGAS